MTAARVTAYVPDLMDRSRVAAAAPDTRFVDRPDDLLGGGSETDVVVVDLGRPGVIEIVGRIEGRVVGFASHVDRDVIEAATAAGCDEVLPRSQFFRRIGQIVARR